MEAVICDVCGDGLNYADDQRCIGVAFDFSGDHPAATRVMMEFGKTNFNICNCCFLKSLGVKPAGCLGTANLGHAT